MSKVKKTLSRMLVAFGWGRTVPGGTRLVAGRWLLVPREIGDFSRVSIYRVSGNGHRQWRAEAADMDQARALLPTLQAVDGVKWVRLA